MDTLKSKLKPHELVKAKKMVGKDQRLMQEFTEQVQKKVKVDVIPDDIFTNYDQKLFGSFMEYFVLSEAKRAIKGKDVEKMLRAYNFEDPQVLRAFGSEGVSHLISDFFDQLTEKGMKKVHLNHLTDIIALRNGLAENEFDYITKRYQLFLKKQINAAK